MNKLIKFLRPLNNLIWDYLVKNKFILFCGGGDTVIEAPKPINVEESMRDYLEAITDPELVGKQLDAESIFGPQFDLVSLSRTQTMLEGIKDPKESAMYLQATARRAALEAKKAALEAGTPEDVPSDEDVNAIVDKLFPKPERSYKSKGRRESKEAYAKRLETYERQREILVNQYSKGLDVPTLNEIDQELADANNEITRIENMPAQKGILDMAEDAAERMADLQGRIDRAKREGDIADLEDLGPGLVEALRKADPESTTLAEASSARAAKAQRRAMQGVPQTEERMAMGEIAQQGRDRIAQLEALEAAARTPEENQELQNLKGIRDRQAGMFAQAQARAGDPTSVQERATMGFLGDAATMAAMSAGQDPSQFEEFQNLQQLGDMGMLSAEAAQARAMNPDLAEGRAEMGQLADLAQAQALDPTSNAERAALGDMAEQSRDFASQLMQEAQNPALPNEERQRLIAMSQQQEERANSLYEQAQTISDQRQAAGSLAELSAQQARQLSADAMGPLSAQRRRMAEQAARQQGLRTGRIGDQMQLASELLNREEQRALLRAEAREAQDLAYRQAAGFATDVETDAQRLREEGRLTTGQSFDMGREIQSDLDTLTAQRRAQALAAQGDARSATTDLLDIDKGFRDEAFDRQQALIDVDEGFREEARLERQAAQLEQRGLLAEARSLRDEAATRRSEAMEMQESIAEFDKGLREEAQAQLSKEGQMTAGILSAEEALRQQRLDEAAGLRGEISAAEQTAFTREGQLAAMDESLRATAQAEADAASQTAFSQARNISAPATGYLTGVVPGGAQAGQSFVSQGPQVSQSFGEMFNPERGIDIANVNTQNMLNRNIAQANVNAQQNAGVMGMFGDVVSAFNPFKLPGKD